MAIYRSTVSCIDQRGGLCLHALHGGIFGVLSDVWSVCLLIIRSNTYSLDSGGLLEIRGEYDGQHHHKGGYWTCEIRFIRILESLTA